MPDDHLTAKWTSETKQTWQPKRNKIKQKNKKKQEQEAKHGIKQGARNRQTIDILL